MFTLEFFINSLLLGIGLSADAFCVSLANGLNSEESSKSRAALIGATFSAFQAIMPLTGWFLIRTVLNWFQVFEYFIPWIALILLCFLGGKTIYEAVKNKDCENPPVFTFGALIVQGVATSIDALSAGLSIAHYTFLPAFVCALIIGITTFILCFIGVFLGKKFGTKLKGKANIIGGIILIAIGLEIFISGIIELYI